MFLVRLRLVEQQLDKGRQICNWIRCECFVFKEVEMIIRRALKQCSRLARSSGCAMFLFLVAPVAGFSSFSPGGGRRESWFAIFGQRGRPPWAEGRALGARYSSRLQLQPPVQSVQQPVGGWRGHLDQGLTRLLVVSSQMWEVKERFAFGMLCIKIHQKENYFS